MVVEEAGLPRPISMWFRIMVLIESQVIRTQVKYFHHHQLLWTTSGKDSWSCRFGKKAIGATISSFRNVNPTERVSSWTLDIRCQSRNFDLVGSSICCGQLWSSVRGDQCSHGEAWKIWRWSVLWPVLLPVQSLSPRCAGGGVWVWEWSRLLAGQEQLGQRLGWPGVHQDGKKLQQHVQHCLLGQLSCCLECFVQQNNRTIKQFITD